MPNCTRNTLVDLEDGLAQKHSVATYFAGNSQLIIHSTPNRSLRLPK